MAGFGGYNAFLGAIKAARGITHREAQQAYRGLSARLGRAPKAADVTAHPRIVKAEATKAAADLKRIQAKSERLAKATARAQKAHGREKGSRGGRADRGGGRAAPELGQGGGAGAGAAAVPPKGGVEFEQDYGSFEDEEFYDFEDPLTDTGEASE